MSTRSMGSLRDRDARHSEERRGDELEFVELARSLF